jgi:hypothetical protein
MNSLPAHDLPPAISHSRSPILSSQRQTLLSLITAFVIILLLIQLWLLIHLVEETLRGDSSIMLPAVLISGLCSLGAGSLWRTLSYRS